MAAEAENEEMDRMQSPPENWEYYGKPEYGAGDERFRNDCGLWLVIEGSKVVTWVGNFHIAVRGTEEVIGRFENKMSARDAAFEWMEENPNPWDDGIEGSDGGNQ